MVAAEVVWCIALVVLFITRNPTEAYAIKVWCKMFYFLLL
jgi:hypothetical protein